MRPRFLVLPSVLVLALVAAVPLAAQQVESRAAVGRARSAPQTSAHDAATVAVRAAVAAADSGRGLPRWVRWGLVGAAAGAVTFPLLNGLSPNPERSSGRAAAEGAVVGFALIGGSVALWDALCRGDTRSRRAGLC
jgi:hypothetical protein